jgi:hypothetical protein
VLIDGSGLWTFCHFIWISSWFYLIFIGEFGSNNGSSTNVEAPVVLEATPNFIGAALLPVPWAKQGAFAAPLTNFRGFFFIRRTSPISRK